MRNERIIIELSNVGDTLLTELQSRPQPSLYKKRSVEEIKLGKEFYAIKNALERVIEAKNIILRAI